MNNHLDRIAILIPCYNEEKTIEKVVKDFKTVLPDAVVYVYDNNSSDNTASIARSAGAIVRSEYSQGKGNVIRRMFREVNAQCYIMVDGDDTYPAEAAVEMMKRVFERNADMVIGDRLSTTYFSENKRPFHNMGNTLVRGLINQMFRTDIRDIMTGYRAFSYQFVKSFPVLSSGFEIETEMSIHAADKHMRMENVIVDYRDRPEGSQSKLNTIPDGLKVLGTVLELFRTYKPMAFFSVLAAVMAAVSVGFMIPVLFDWYKTGLVARFPTLIVCGFVMLAAILSFYAGVILQTIRKKDRQDFEMRLLQIAVSKTAAEERKEFENGRF